MQKKVLVALDDSLGSTKALNYVSRLNQVIPNLSFHLITIQPGISQFITDEAEKSMKARAELNQLMKKNHEASEKLLLKHRQALIEKGVESRQIETKTTPRVKNIAGDLLGIAEMLEVDALLIGRRGVNSFQSLVSGSVTANLLNHSMVIPIWMVDGEVSSDKVLLPVDGSSASLRALDHLAFILSGTKNAKIHMLHVESGLEDFCQIEGSLDQYAAMQNVVLDHNQKCIDSFLNQSLTVLQKNNLSKDQIQLDRIKGGGSVAKNILGYAAKNKIGTLVVGKSSQKKSLFFGSISRKIIQKAENQAVWMIP